MDLGILKVSAVRSHRYPHSSGDAPQSTATFDGLRSRNGGGMTQHNTLGSSGQWTANGDA